MKKITKALLIVGLVMKSAVAWSAMINPGDIFISVATPNDGSVFRITQVGSVSVFASGLDSPSGLAFSPDGQLYVVERSGEITNITLGGNFTSASAHAFGFGFNSLRNLLIDNSGRILVANRAQGTVIDVTAGGSASSATIFASGLDGTRDVFQTRLGEIYAVEEFSGEVTNVTAGGDFRFATPFASGFDLPYALAESPDHELFLAEVLTGNVFNITGGGNDISLFASNLGVTDEIIFNIDGTFLAVQEFENTIVDISAGGTGSYALFASNLGAFPQQIAIAPSPVPLPGAIWLLLSGFAVLAPLRAVSRKA